MWAVLGSVTPTIQGNLPARQLTVPILVAYRDRESAKMIRRSDQKCKAIF